MTFKINFANNQSISIECDSVEIGDMIINNEGIQTTADLRVGSEGSGAAIVINDGNLPNGEGVRLQATDSQNVAVELPTTGGKISLES